MLLHRQTCRGRSICHGLEGCCNWNTWTQKKLWFKENVVHSVLQDLNYKRKSSDWIFYFGWINPIAWVWFLCIYLFMVDVLHDVQDVIFGLDWEGRNTLQLNVTKKMVVDFRRTQSLVCILGEDVEVVESGRCIWVHLDNKLDWGLKQSTRRNKADSTFETQVLHCWLWPAPFYMKQKMPAD